MRTATQARTTDHGTRQSSRQVNAPARGVSSAGTHASILALQRSAGNQAVSRLLGTGRPLEPGVQTTMEALFNHDFSDVRVHSGQNATDSAASLGARAYTVGNNVVFGNGLYSPATPAGRLLLSHELAHVVQQSGASGVVGSAAATETEARQAAGRVAAGSPAQVSLSAPHGVQRQALTDEEAEQAATTGHAGASRSAPQPKSLDIDLNEKKLSDDALDAEIDAILAYLHQNPNGPHVPRLQEALQRLQVERNRRDQAALNFQHSVGEALSGTPRPAAARPPDSPEMQELIFQRELDRALGAQKAEANVRRLQVRPPAPVAQVAMVGEAMGGEAVLVPLAEGARSVVEFVIRSLPVISTGINIYEAAAGKDVFTGEKLGTGQRVVAAIFVAIDLIPVAGRLLHAGTSGARALATAAKTAGGAVTARRSLQVLRGLSALSKEEEALIREAATVMREGKALNPAQEQALKKLEGALGSSAEKSAAEGATSHTTQQLAEGENAVKKSAPAPSEQTPVPSEQTPVPSEQTPAQGSTTLAAAKGASEKVGQAVFKDLPGAKVLEKKVIDGATFTRYARAGAKGNVIVEEAQGVLRLTEEGTASKAQSAARRQFGRQSGGMVGDHAGHKIAASLGGPAAMENLARQNAVANATGTWRNLEKRWTELLKSGEATKIEVRVSDSFEQGATRPFRRDVQAIETLADGTTRTLNLGEGGTVIFGNFPSRPRAK